MNENEKEQLISDNEKDDMTMSLIKREGRQSVSKEHHEKNDLLF